MVSLFLRIAGTSDVNGDRSSGSPDLAYHNHVNQGHGSPQRVFARRILDQIFFRRILLRKSIADYLSKLVRCVSQAKGCHLSFDGRRNKDESVGFKKMNGQNAN